MTGATAGRGNADGHNCAVSNNGFGLKETPKRRGKLVGMENGAADVKNLLF